MSLFNALHEELGELTLSVIAEDLGIIDKKVVKLLDKSGLRGMHVLQFAFLGDGSQLPHRITEKSVTYTGTHDNTTLLAWMHELSEHEREGVLFYTGYEGDWSSGGPNCAIAKHWMKVLFKTASSLVVVPIQDMLGYGSDTRTNIPGTATGNWCFRIRTGVLSEIDSEFYRRLHKVYYRNDPVKEFKGK
jgi:4-alpha-glucanotransferase